MPDQDYFENQTIFAEEEPYHIADRKKKQIEALAVKKRPLLRYAVGAILVVLVLFVGIASLIKRNPAPPGAVVSPTPTSIPQTSSQVDQMMLELRSAVDNADPSKTSLPFPPVADKIQISQ